MLSDRPFGSQFAGMGMRLSERGSYIIKLCRTKTMQNQRASSEKYFAPYVLCCVMLRKLVIDVTPEMYFVIKSIFDQEIAILRNKQIDTVALMSTRTPRKQYKYIIHYSTETIANNASVKIPECRTIAACASRRKVSKDFRRRKSKSYTF